MYLKLCIVSFILRSVFSVDLPADMIICKRSDPNISECLKTAIMKAHKVFKDGNEELGLAPLDPLLVPEFILVQSKTNRNFHLSMSYKNLYIKGISDAQFENFKARVTPDLVTIETDVVFPDLEFNGEYELLGKLVFLPLRSKDKVRNNMENVAGKVRLDLEATDNDGVKYLLVKSATFSISPPTANNKYTLRFNNLVKGNKELSDKMNKILEENVQGLQDVFKPSINSFFSHLYSNTASKFFSTVPMDQILPP